MGTARCLAHVCNQQISAHKRLVDDSVVQPSLPNMAHVTEVKRYLIRFTNDRTLSGIDLAEGLPMGHG